VSYPRELLDSAHTLLHSDPETQATLRQTVSTAYYALFHFLIEEACLNWARPEHRHRLTRAFEHKNMAAASNRRIESHKNAEPPSVESQLYSVAFAFKQLQDQRHIADYDLSSTLSGQYVVAAVELAEEAFATWGLIRNEQIAHDYLFALLFREDRTYPGPISIIDSPGFTGTLGNKRHGAFRVHFAELHRKALAGVISVPLILVMA